MCFSTFLRCGFIDLLGNAKQSSLSILPPICQNRAIEINIKKYRVLIEFQSPPTIVYKPPSHSFCSLWIGSELARKEIPDHHHLLNESFLSSIQSHNSAEWRTPFCGMAGVAWRVPFHEALRCAAVEFTLRSMVVPEEYINEYGWWFPPLFRYRFCTCAVWPIKSELASRPDPIRTNWLSLAYMQLGLFTERSSAWQHASAFR